MKKDRELCEQLRAEWLRLATVPAGLIQKDNNI